MAWMVSSDISGYYQPPHFPKPNYTFSKNPLDSAIVDLGRVLFYDPILSGDNTISCASCHSPYNAFAHTDHDLSHGIHDSIGQRNAPALFNLAWQPLFMWDGAINHLDVQALAPISHPNEMGSNIQEVMATLRKDSLYRTKFAYAFKDTAMSTARVLKALSQFQLTLVSAGAKYDDVVMGKAVFTEQEKKGYFLFQKHCNDCHAEPLFSDYSFQNNGLSLDATLQDMGRYKISGISSDKQKFKVPSLRNLSYSYPYMHDGRFNTLQQVLTHYTRDMMRSPDRSALLRDTIALSSNDRVDLIAFLLTLNDKAFIFDKNHSYKKY